MLKKILLLSSIFLFLMVGAVHAQAIPAANYCATVNISALQATDTKVLAYDGTRKDFRIHIDGGSTSKMRCTFGNAFGSVPNASSSTVGYEILGSNPDFDAYPFVPPGAETHCYATSGTPTLSILTCQQ